jgi:hypothetical protein
VAWRRSVALLQAREEEEEDKGKKRRREEKRRAWPGGGALRCCRREKRRRRTNERREEERSLIGADQDQDLFFSIATLSCFQTRNSITSFLSLALLKKPNHEAKAWRRWWWC